MIRLIRKYALLFTALLCAVYLAAFSILTERLSDSRQKEQLEGLEQALDRCITTCYALEGFFPPDLAYMEEHYGLLYDKNLFFVDYQPVAANIRPDYVVIPVKEERP